jgi:dihydroorotate dehydrogenase electron transfer subunit
MLRRLSRECREHRWPMQATVDAPMACGMGLCLGCAAPGCGERAYRLVCKDGPVFGLDDLDWEKAT